MLKKNAKFSPVRPPSAFLPVSSFGCLNKIIRRDVENQVIVHCRFFIFDIACNYCYVIHRFLTMVSIQRKCVRCANLHGETRKFKDAIVTLTRITMWIRRKTRKRRAWYRDLCARKENVFTERIKVKSDGRWAKEEEWRWRVVCGQQGSKWR